MRQGAFLEELEKIAADIRVLMRARKRLLDTGVARMAGFLPVPGSITIPGKRLQARLSEISPAYAARDKHALPEVLDYVASLKGKPQIVLQPGLDASNMSRLSGRPLDARTGHLSALTAMHETFEMKVKPSEASPFFSHASPDVLLQEHNMLSRLRGGKAAKQQLRGARNFVSEDESLRRLLVGEFKDPRAAQFLEDGNKVPKSMRKALNRKLRQDPHLAERYVPATLRLAEQAADPAGAARFLQSRAYHRPAAPVSSLKSPFRDGGGWKTIDDSRRVFRLKGT